jgi:hypothetical protein
MYFYKITVSMTCPINFIWELLVKIGDYRQKIFKVMWHWTCQSKEQIIKNVHPKLHYHNLIKFYTEIHFHLYQQVDSGDPITDGVLWLVLVVWDAVDVYALEIVHSSEN